MPEIPTETRITALAALKNRKEKTVADVAREFGVGLSTLERWAKEERAGVSPQDYKKPGRPRGSGAPPAQADAKPQTLTQRRRAAIDELLRELLLESPSASTDELASCLRQRLDLKITGATVAKRLKALGFKRVRLENVPEKETGKPERYGYAPGHRRSGTSEAYPSSLTDAEWDLVKDLFERTGPGRPEQYPRRQLVNAIVYVVRTGIPWRFMPKDLPRWQNVYASFRRWGAEGLFEQMQDRLRKMWRAREGRSEEPTAAIIDSQSVKTTEKGGSAVMTGRRRSRGGSITSRRTQRGSC